MRGGKQFMGQTYVWMRSCNHVNMHMLIDRGLVNCILSESWSEGWFFLGWQLLNTRCSLSLSLSLSLSVCVCLPSCLVVLYRVRAGLIVFYLHTSNISLNLCILVALTTSSFNPFQVSTILCGKLLFCIL